jgi:ATP phosphoribosyltransferase
VQSRRSNPPLWRDRGTAPGAPDHECPEEDHGIGRCRPACHEKPTVSQLHGIDYFSIQTVVNKRAVNQLIPQLKAAGAEDILEIPITKIVR